MPINLSTAILNDFVILPSLAAEEKVSKLQDALKEVQNTHIKEVSEMNAQLDRQRQRCEELTEAVSSSLVNYSLRRMSLGGAQKTMRATHINFQMTQLTCECYSKLI